VRHSAAPHSQWRWSRRAPRRAGAAAGPAALDAENTVVVCRQPASVGADRAVATVFVAHVLGRCSQYSARHRPRAPRLAYSLRRPAALPRRGLPLHVCSLVPRLQRRVRRARVRRAQGPARRRRARCAAPGAGDAGDDDGRERVVCDANRLPDQPDGAAAGCAFRAAPRPRPTPALCTSHSLTCTARPAPRPHAPPPCQAATRLPTLRGWGCR
jgi:hypothetical protein